MPWHFPDTTIISGAFTLNNIQYPSNWLALAPAEEKATLGIYWTEPEPPPPPEPPTLTPWQVRKILRRENLLDTVLALVATLDADGKDGWEYATYFEYTNPLVQYVMTSAGKTQEQIKQLFFEGALL